MREKRNYGRVNGRCGAECKLQEALEDMFAEACLPGYSKEEAEYVCFERAKELHRLVRELVDTFAVAVEWKCAGSKRAYTSSVYVSPEGIRKGKDTEWHRTELEAEAPRPPSLYFRLEALVEARFKNSEILNLIGFFCIR